jgi:L-ascorbate metabolism protein UlaG (beta-lactamase superfamily)
MTHAVHSCGILDDGKIVYGGEAAGYVLRFEDGRALYFAGDTNVFTDMQLIEQLYSSGSGLSAHRRFVYHEPPGSRGGVPDAAAEKVVPMHFGTFPALTGRPEQLAALIGDLPDTEVWALEPGKPVEW